MTPDKIIVTTIGIFLIGIIYWFFFGKKDELVSVESGKIKIIVEGGYKPGVIKTKVGEEVQLLLTRSDQNSCLEEVVIPDFGIKEYLPINQEVSIKFTPEHKGEYDIHCGMNMFHGKIIVN